MGKRWLDSEIEILKDMLSKENGLNYKRIMLRINRGYDIIEAINKENEEA